MIGNVSAIWYNENRSEKMSDSKLNSGQKDDGSEIILKIIWMEKQEGHWEKCQLDGLERLWDFRKEVHSKSRRRVGIQFEYTKAFRNRNRVAQNEMSANRWRPAQLFRRTEEIMSQRKWIDFRQNRLKQTLSLPQWIFISISSRKLLGTHFLQNKAKKS